jgi:dipeptidyl aminopeptidase/acylaminoacyl peptidase
MLASVVRKLQLSLSVLILCVYMAAVSAAAQTRFDIPIDVAPVKRPITVADEIAMTRLSNEGDADEQSSEGGAALFSPDGKQFVILLRRGHLKENLNESSLCFFYTSQAFRAPKAKVLISMFSASNQDAIRQVKWLSDSRTITFIGERPGKPSQVFSIDVRTYKLQQLTKVSTAVETYDISAKGDKLLFVALPHTAGARETRNDRQRAVMVNEGSVAKEHLLANVIAGRGQETFADQLFFQEKGTVVRITLGDALSENSWVAFSPDGSYALVLAHVRMIPPQWRSYSGNYFQTIMENVIKRGPDLRINRYWVLDTIDNSIEPLVNAPMFGSNHFAWAADGESIFLRNIFLPLDGVSTTETEIRSKNKFDAEVRLASRTSKIIDDSQWPQNEKPRPPIQVSLEEDYEHPPKVVVSHTRMNDKVVLLDLNPQFAQLELGRVDHIKWHVDPFHTIDGLLYLPRDYREGLRYPLVIQTHAFRTETFSMDGSMDDWSSAFAARQLAANGIMVLQTKWMPPLNDPQEGPNQMAVFESAIEYLNRLHLIDPTKVGIAGFSRTVYHVEYTLTHSKCSFAAAYLTDGIGGGYFEFMAFGSPDSALVNGGPPFGEGLRLWLDRSPSFNLQKVETPVGLLALRDGGSVLSMWEWFNGLRELNKPVELAYLPGAAHIIKQPWHRYTAQQSFIDWFLFWLKGEEDGTPSKTSQYAHWRNLRRQATNPEGWDPQK